MKVRISVYKSTGNRLVRDLIIVLYRQSSCKPMWLWGCLIADWFAKQFLNKLSVCLKSTYRGILGLCVGGACLAHLRIYKLNKRDAVGWLSAFETPITVLICIYLGVFLFPSSPFLLLPLLLLSPFPWSKILNFFPSFFVTYKTFCIIHNNEER